MGEYAKLKSTGERVKIGTCENMYYLRADQIGDVVAVGDSVDPAGEYQGELRFRFPWPDEDGVAPGAFEDPFRARAVHGVDLPDIEHGIVQFVAQAGYNVCLPCPEGPSSHGLNVHRNGFKGAVKIVQQRYWQGQLVTVCECGGCGHKYRLETWAMAEPVVVALRSEADRKQAEFDLHAQRQGIASLPCHDARMLHTIADRITAGYLFDDADHGPGCAGAVNCTCEPAGLS